MDQRFGCGALGPAQRCPGVDAVTPAGIGTTVNQPLSHIETSMNNRQTQPPRS
jgi:hypothetical protein